MKEYPDYGQYIPKDYLKAFLHGFPYLWADKKYWDVNRAELSFDFLAPFINKYNGLQPKVLHVICLMLDESKSGWQPKTSKRGGLPHISHKPRKPIPLGTMICDSVECTTEIFVHMILWTHQTSNRKRSTAYHLSLHIYPRKKRLATIVHRCYVNVKRAR